LSGKLIASLFLPYILVAIIGLIAEMTFTSETSQTEDLVNSIMNVEIGTAKETSSDGNPIQAGYSFVTDSTGVIFGFATYTFQILTLNYSFWGADQPMAYQMVRFLLIVLGIPALISMGFKSIELMSRFITAVGTVAGRLLNYLPSPF
tara:strand:- start:690 stop:1133 length:444 start_codon:yes stop_codon:yes gene_type:complete